MNPKPTKKPPQWFINFEIKLDQRLDKIEERLDTIEKLPTIAQELAERKK